MIASLVSWLLVGATQTERIRMEKTEVHAVAFAPDGKHLAIGCRDKSLTLWDLEKRLHIRTFQGQEGGVTDVAFTSDGRALVSASAPSIQVWDVESTKELRKFKGGGSDIYPTRCVISPDGKLVASNEGWKVFVHELESGKRVLETKGTFHITSLTFAPDGKSIVSGDGYGEVYVWDLATGKNQVEFEFLPGMYVRFSPAGRMLASAGPFDSSVRLWEIPSGAVRRTLAAPDNDRGSKALAFSPDGRWLAAGERTIAVWETASGMEVHRFSGHSDPVRSLSFSPDGAMLASGSNDGSVLLWDLRTDDWSALATRKLEPLMLTAAETVHAIAFRANGKALASATRKTDLQVWDLPAGTPGKAITDYSTAFAVLGFRSDGSLILLGRDHKRPTLWNVSEGKVLATFPESGGALLALSPDHTKVVTTGLGGEIDVWDAATGKKLHELTGHESFVNRLTFSADGKRLASGDYTQEVRVWDLEGGRALLNLDRHSGMGFAFSPDGKWLALASDKGTVRLREIDGSEARTLSGHSESVDSLAFSPDGGLLAAGAGRTITFWDVPAGREIRKVEGLPKETTGEVRLLLFSPDGKTLASAGAHLIRIWLLKD